jgi:putative transcriptional regulator
MSKATKTRKQYMSDEEFAELKESLSEVVSYLKGKPTGIKVTLRAAQPKPKVRSRKEIARLRQRLHYSQSGFARALNVSVKTGQAWEQGLRVPSDAALKLLAIAQRHPDALVDSE